MRVIHASFPNITITPSYRRWQLSSDFNLVIMVDPITKLHITIKRGGYTDFASIPPLLRGLFLSNRPSQCIPALVHDVMVGQYAGQVEYQWTTKNLHDPTTRGEADWDFATDVFEALLTYYNEKSWRSHFLVKGVKLWGKLKGK